MSTIVMMSTSQRIEVNPATKMVSIVHSGVIGPGGPPGATGPPGSTGPQGETGEQGPIGPIGDTGPAGPEGPTGPEGPAGADGTDGGTGATGPPGPAGPTGPTGATGSGVSDGDKGDIVVSSDGDVWEIQSGVYGIPQPYYTLASGAHTFTPAEAGYLIKCSDSGAVTITAPSDADQDIPVGVYMDVIQIGTGQVTVVAGSGATLQISGLTAKARAQYSRLGVQKVAANTWSLFGDLAAS